MRRNFGIVVTVFLWYRYRWKKIGDKIEIRSVMMMADHAGLKLHVSHASAVERSIVVLRRI